MTAGKLERGGGIPFFRWHREQPQGCQDVSRHGANTEERAPAPEHCMICSVRQRLRFYTVVNSSVWLTPTMD